MGLTRIIAGVWRLAIAGLCFAATAEAWSIPNRWVYFTFQAGFLMGLVMVWAGAATILDGIQPPAWMKNGVTVYVVIVALMAFLLPSSESSGSTLLPGVSGAIVLHRVVPLMAVADFLLVDAHRRSRWEHVLVWMSYLPPYLAFVLIRGALWPHSGPVAGGSPYPYDVIDPSSVGWIQLGINCLELVVVFLGVALAVFIVDRMLPPSSIMGVAGRGRSSRSRR
ncbi:MAG: Pr6Pr family membrane protein [Bifidobacterium minimum]|jgi:hypothetical protein|nr:Pr6Pr family membrane protein [Bifidobacterium minimum]